MKERLAIAERLIRESKHRPVPGIEWVQSFATDVPSLLARIEELETENQRLHKDNKRMTSLYYRPQAQEVMHELVELETENERLRAATPTEKQRFSDHESRAIEHARKRLRRLQDADRRMYSRWTTEDMIAFREVLRLAGGGTV